MGVSDKLVGGFFLLVASFVFIYYTTWAIFLPFLPPSHPLHASFPAREWAVWGPALLLVAGVSAIGLFIGLVMYREGQKRRSKQAMKAA